MLFDVPALFGNPHRFEIPLTGGKKAVFLCSHPTYEQRMYAMSCQPSESLQNVVSADYEGASPEERKQAIAEVIDFEDLAAPAVVKHKLARLCIHKIELPEGVAPWWEEGKFRKKADFCLEELSDEVAATIPSVVLIEIGRRLMEADEVSEELGKESEPLSSGSSNESSEGIQTPA